MTDHHRALTALRKAIDLATDTGDPADRRAAQRRAEALARALGEEAGAVKAAEGDLLGSFPRLMAEAYIDGQDRYYAEHGHWADGLKPEGASRSEAGAVVPAPIGPVPHIHAVTPNDPDHCVYCGVPVVVTVRERRA
jgi:hypothetical protein